MALGAQRASTILDFSHCNNTPEHADAALQGLRDASIRALFAYGYYPAPSPRPAFADHEQRLADARRIRERELPGQDTLVTMGVALTETGLLPFEQTLAEARSARELEVPCVLHTGCNWGSPVTGGLAELGHHGMLDPGQVHVHCNTLSQRDLRRLADGGCKVLQSGDGIQMGMGHPVRAGRLLGCGSLSCDVCRPTPGTCSARCGSACVRARMRNDASTPAAAPDRLGPKWRRWLGDPQQGPRSGRADRLAGARRAGGRDRGRPGFRLNLVPMADPVGACRPGEPGTSVTSSSGDVSQARQRLVGVELERAADLEVPASVLGASAPPRARCWRRCRITSPTIDALRPDLARAWNIAVETIGRTTARRLPWTA